MRGNTSSELTLGGTQHHNTARKIGKYRNTVSTIDEITMPHLDPFYNRSRSLLKRDVNISSHV